MKSTTPEEYKEIQLQSAMKKLEKAGIDHQEYKAHMDSAMKISSKELLRKVKIVNKTAMR